MVISEEIISARERVVNVMFALCCKIWGEEKKSEEWIQSIIIPRYSPFVSCGATSYNHNAGKTENRRDYRGCRLQTWA